VITQRVLAQMPESGHDLVGRVLMAHDSGHDFALCGSQRGMRRALVHPPQPGSVGALAN
jgi:hypothetical protein